MATGTIWGDNVWDDDAWADDVWADALEAVVTSDTLIALPGESGAIIALPGALA